MSEQAPSPRDRTAHSQHWPPHSSFLSACVITLNVALVFLVYFYFWRVFWRKGRPSAASALDAPSLATTSPTGSPRVQNRHELEQLVQSLPTFVYSSRADGGAATVECAVCIAELKDGDEGRLLPRCGHRFHAACVDAWFRCHATCPLCRACVATATAAEAKGGASCTAVESPV